MTPPLRLARASLEEILRHARETDPDECCGAVVTLAGREEVWRLANVQDELHRRDPVAYPRTARTAYALSREDTERIDAATLGKPEAGELRVIYHSHAKHGAYFSGEDRARALFGDEPMFPDVAYLVVSDARESGETRAYRWSPSDHDFVEVPIDLT